MRFEITNFAAHYAKIAIILPRCRFISIFLCILLAGCFRPFSLRAQKGYVISVKNAEQVLTEETLRHRVAYLSDSLRAGRQTGTPGSTWAIGWIGQQFRHQGLLPLGGSYYHGVRTRSGRTGHNVIGFLPGHQPSCIVVMAHFDHLGVLGGKMYPGADSNASGVAALLSLADMFSYLQSLGRDFGQNILFVALDAKEQSMAGAETLWKELEAGLLTDPRTGRAFRKSDISLVVNIDQVGSVLSPIRPRRPDYLMMLSEPSTGRRDLLTLLNDKEGTHLDLGFDYYGSKDFTRLFYRQVSDQKVFLDNGIPAVMFTSGITLNNNKPYDNLSTLNFPVFRRRVLLMFYYLARIA